MSYMECGLVWSLNLLVCVTSCQCSRGANQGAQQSPYEPWSKLLMNRSIGVVGDPYKMVPRLYIDSFDHGSYVRFRLC